MDVTMATECLLLAGTLVFALFPITAMSASIRPSLDCSSLPPTMPSLQNFQRNKISEIAPTLENTIHLADYQLPIFNLTADQAMYAMCQYSAVFRPRSEVTHIQQAASLRSCSAIPYFSQVHRARDMNGNLVQVVQLPQLDLYQWFYEEECQSRFSDFADVECVVAHHRLALAFVIDLESEEARMDWIKVRSCTASESLI